MTKLVFVMGVQRSGTGALYYALAEDPAVLAVPESKANELYERWNLRPEPEVRRFLTEAGKTVLTKPVNETNRRGAADVLEEFGDYESRTVWIYRDPVNVFASTLEWYGVPRGANDAYYDSLAGVKDPAEALEAFTRMWNRRNRSFLALPENLRERAALVKYEDMIASPGAFHALCAFLGVRGVHGHKFLPDSRSGCRRLEPAVRDAIAEAARETWLELEGARTFRPESSFAEAAGT